MVENLTLGVMVDIASILFGPDALCHDRVVLLLEAAGDDHAGSGQGSEPERNLASQSVECCKEKRQAADKAGMRPLTFEHRASAA